MEETHIQWIWFHFIEQIWRHSQTSYDSSFSVRHNCIVLIDLFSLLSLVSQRWSIQDYKSHTFTVKMDSIMTTQQKMRRNLFITDRRRVGKIQEKDSETRLKEKHMASRQSLVTLTFWKWLLDNILCWWLMIRFYFVVWFCSWFLKMRACHTSCPCWHLLNLVNSSESLSREFDSLWRQWQKIWEIIFFLPFKS